MKNKYKRIIMSCVFIFVALGCLLVVTRYWQDRVKFEKSQQNVSKYFSSLPNPRLETTGVSDYCSRNHLKYSEGSLGCGYTITYKTSSSIDEDKLLSDIFGGIKKNLGWVENGSNLQSMKEMTGKDIIKSETYQSDRLACNVYIARQTTGGLYLVDVNCDGPAMWEWYPVKEN